MAALKQPIEVRFWKYVLKTSKCWLWTASVVNGNYGTIDVDGKRCMAHRIAYELLTGKKLPKRLTIDHLCRNRRCVRPSHLEPVSSRENTLRGFGPTAINARKKFCIHRHPLRGKNVYRYKYRGQMWRACRECKRISDRRNYAKSRGN